MKKIKLGDVLDVKRGASLSGKFYSTEGKYIRLTLGNFSYPNGGFKSNASKKDIYFTGKIDDSYILKKDDIITPLTEQVNGLLGETAKIPEDNLYIQSGDVGLILPNEDIVDKNFLYYLISSPLIKKQLGASAQQTKIRHTSPDKIIKCIAWIPEIEEQRKFGSILDYITNLIENDRCLVDKLNEQIMSIYDFWFNQYQFPNIDGNPYKDNGGKFNEESIPE